MATLSNSALFPLETARQELLPYIRLWNNSLPIVRNEQLPLPVKTPYREDTVH